MELLVTLRNANNIDKLKTACEGFVVGSLFTTGYHFSTSELIKVRKYCLVNKIKCYVTIENFINEEDKIALINYIDLLKQLDVDGIYYHDLGVYEVAKSFNIENKLIYDGQTIVCNSLDVAFYMSKGIDGVVISRELTLDEIKQIIMNNNQCCDLFIFGHQRLSYSKRQFIKNYMNEIVSSYDYRNKETLALVEEKRDYRLPIIEDENGTKIYTDYVFEMYKELAEVRPYIKRGIVDSLFIDDDEIITVLRDYHRITSENASFLLEHLKQNHPDSYSSGYLYQKTNITKDE